MDKTNVGKLEIGDTIICQGMTITIADIKFQDHYDSSQWRDEEWIMEFVDTKGVYRSWKSAVDGGSARKKI